MDLNILINPGVDKWVKINPHLSPLPINPSTPEYDVRISANAKLHFF